MKEVEWWVAKVYPKSKEHRSRIDLWERFDTKAKAQAYVRKDGYDTPFVVVKCTQETVATRARKR